MSVRRGHPAVIAMWVWFGLAVVFLFTPIATSIVYSFNLGVGGRQTSALTGWTLQWYGAAASDPSLMSALRTSLVVAFWAALIALVMGGALGYALVRNPTPWVRRVLAALTYILLIVPETVIGVSLLFFYTQTHVPLGLATLVAGHTPLSISVVAFVVRARLLTLDRSIEEAAADLGAGPLTVIRLILVPQLAPALAASALLAYTFSFDNVVISNFLSTAQIGTLPVYLYGSLQYGPSPAVYATAVVVFAATVVLIGIAALVLRRGFGARSRATELTV